MVIRLFVEKRPGFDVEAEHLTRELRENQGLSALERVRVFKRYDIEGVTERTMGMARGVVFSEPNQDTVYDENLPAMEGAALLYVQYLPGQYDQRADSCEQCIQLLTADMRPTVRTAQVYALYGALSDGDMAAVKAYLINPVESEEARADKPATLAMDMPPPEPVPVLKGFINLNDLEIVEKLGDLSLSMSADDLLAVRDYFIGEERDPTMAEIRVLDTYWSDHCRHTTFLTELTDIQVDNGRYTTPIKDALAMYRDLRDATKGPECLMDIALTGMRALRRMGKLRDLDESDEINACSIEVDVNEDGKNVPYLLMFKNETHNHPTEIEPFGGAATCLGGAIRDPLSGRAYVYQAMRITGAGDPRTPVGDTPAGKLPQRKIADVSSRGYSSYGNQIGIATGYVRELYHPGYVAKHMELGAVIGAAPKSHVVRKEPVPGDVIILVGGATGRDGIGGATGSSKSHDEASLATCGAQVQKGNAPVERALQRLFRKHDFARMIKRCNDFGAGGVSVAIGELAPGIIIDLDAVPKKYAGLDGTELAISESQERMACVIDRSRVDAFIAMANEENLDATHVADVTGDAYVTMKSGGRNVVRLSRAFLDTNGARQHREARVTAPAQPEVVQVNGKNVREAVLENAAALNNASQRGLIERFDNSVGASNVLHPFGGRYRATPSESMVSKLPVRGETTSCSVMAYGGNPRVTSWSPFHGAADAIYEALTKVAAAGGDVSKARLTLQEYFERMTGDPTGWGKPAAALLGALYAQMKLGVPAIGGKDSMSGTFGELNVPPTLIAFAVGMLDIKDVITPEFKRPGSRVYLLETPMGEDLLPDADAFLEGMALLKAYNERGHVLSAHTVHEGGVLAAVSRMALGNRVGFELLAQTDLSALLEYGVGRVVVEIDGIDADSRYFKPIGMTTDAACLSILGEDIALDALQDAFEGTLEGVYPTRAKADASAPFKPYTSKGTVKASAKIAKPRAVVMAFPGSNSEWDTQAALNNAGADASIVQILNRTPRDVDASIKRAADALRSAQMLIIPGGFSAGDEPDGAGKFIAAVLRAPRVAAAVNDLLTVRGGLALGICNGFQALIKVGLVPYGEIRDLLEDDPTLTFNNIGRHAACMADTVVASNLSPWLSGFTPGQVHTVAISHGEGRFAASDAWLERLAAAGQIATQYADTDGKPNPAIPYCPNGSRWAIEGITSPDGRVLGKMGHSERAGVGVNLNVPGENQLGLFVNGVGYFR